MDGAPAPLEQVAPAGMAVRVPAGRHRVEIGFVPYAFHAGALVAGAAALGSLAALLATRRAIR